MVVNPMFSRCSCISYFTLLALLIGAWNHLGMSLKSSGLFVLVGFMHCRIYCEVYGEYAFWVNYLVTIDLSHPIIITLLQVLEI